MTGSDQLSGVGEAAQGRVRAKVGVDGLLERLELDPRALRLGSGELAGQITLAVRTAQEDWSAKRDLGPLDQKMVVRRLDEMQADTDCGYARLMATLDETLRRLDGRP